MPRNKGIGGNKSRKGKKNATYSINKNELVKKDEQQMYARVIKLLGSGRLNALCEDGETRMCKIRGKMMKKDFVKTDGIILISLREYENKKADVIHNYNDDEVRVLVSDGDINKEIISSESNILNKNNNKNYFEIEFNNSESDNDETNKKID